MRNQETYECHRSALALFLKFLLALGPATVLYVMLYQILLLAPETNLKLLNGITVVYRLICFTLTLEMIRLYFNDLYVFGHNRVIRFSGRISFRYGRVAVAFKDIRDIAIQQSLAGRIFNYGTVSFGTSSKDGYEVVMQDLPEPHRFAAFVQDLIQQMRRERVQIESSVEEKPSAA